MCGLWVLVVVPKMATTSSLLWRYSMQSWVFRNTIFHMDLRVLIPPKNEWLLKKQ